MTAIDAETGAAGTSRRQANLDRVVAALRADGPTSQAALARQLDLSPSTLSYIVRTLRADGVAEVTPINKRESVVSLVVNTGAIACVQINADRVSATLFDFEQGSRSDASAEPGSGSPEIVLDLVRQLATASGRAVADLAAVAVAMQGPISTAGTLASWAQRDLPAWKDIALQSLFGEALRIPVVVDNDANLAALAEWTWGAGRGSSPFVLVLASIGIGGGLIVDGSVFRGADGLAGELGHLVVDHAGPVCFCGSRGCLTTFASERSILLALQASGSTRDSLREVIAAARAGDPACQAVLWDAGRYLGRAIANLAKVIAPDTVAIGGILADAGTLLFESLSTSTEITSLRAVSPNIRVVPGEIAQDAPLFGALAAALSLRGQGISAIPSWALHS